MAEANRELTEVNVQQDEINFEQEIRLQVMRFAILRDQLLVAAKADTIAQKRFEVTKERYLIGKISITDLNLSIQEKIRPAKPTYRCCAPIGTTTTCFGGLRSTTSNGRRKSVHAAPNCVSKKAPVGSFCTTAVSMEEMR